jgi:hypothetical protein
MSIIINGQQSERSSKIKEDKINGVYDDSENLPLSTVRIVATACFIP